MPNSTKTIGRSAESLTPEQAADAAALHAGILAAIGDDLAALSALLATKTDATMFGATEFQVRDLVHAIGVILPRWWAISNQKESYHPEAE